jgi:hypothetical protein
MHVIVNFLMNKNGVFRQFTININDSAPCWDLDWTIQSYHLILSYLILSYYTFIRYREMFIFIWQCTQLLPNKIHSINVK